MSLCIALVCTCALCACGSQGGGGGTAPAGGNYVDSVSPDDPYGTGVHHATVTVKGYEPFVIELDADAAPVTVANFCALAEAGFYNGLGFHRVVEGFCLQGGDPAGDGTGGSDQAIVGEFSGNGVTNALADRYQRGTVAMARTNDPNSATSQFFITLSDGAASSLNGQYAAFGSIDEAGMAVVDKIVADALEAKCDPNGMITDPDFRPIIESIEITD